MKLDSAQQRMVERLWFIYGNNGPKHTMENHKFLQRHVEGRHKEAEFHTPTDECRAAFNRVMEEPDEQEPDDRGPAA